MADIMRDHPIVENMERTGYPTHRKGPELVPICPVCHQQCGTISTHEAYVIGCDNCVNTEDAWDIESILGPEP